MSIAVFSDPHWTENPKDLYRHNFVPWFVAKLKKLKVGQVLLLGDLTEVKDNHSAWLVNKVVGHIHDLSKICPVIILKGNHDYVVPSNPYFAFLNELENVEWVNDPTRLDILGYDCLLLPHTRNYKKDWAGVPVNTEWIFAHNTFEGANNGHGHKLSGIPQSVFPKDARVISGDIHTPQQSGCVDYVGAPYRINFGDNFEPRFLEVIDDDLIEHPCPGPRKQLLEISSVKDLNKFKDLSKGDMLKVRVGLSQDQQDDWQKIKDTIRNWGEKQGYVMEHIQPIFEVKRVKKERDQDQKSDEELVRSYAKRTATSDLTLKTGLKLLKGE